MMQFKTTRVSVVNYFFLFVFFLLPKSGAGVLDGLMNFRQDVDSLHGDVLN